jgi:hypothetical protein
MIERNNFFCKFYHLQPISTSDLLTSSRLSICSYPHWAVIFFSFLWYRRLLTKCPHFLSNRKLYDGRITNAFEFATTLSLSLSLPIFLCLVLNLWQSPSLCFNLSSCLIVSLPTSLSFSCYSYAFLPHPYRASICFPTVLTSIVWFCAKCFLNFGT